MILHFAKENDFKVSPPAGPARSTQEGGSETLGMDRFTLVPPASRWAPVGGTLTGRGEGVKRGSAGEGPDRTSVSFPLSRGFESGGLPPQTRWSWALPELALRAPRSVVS